MCLKFQFTIFTGIVNDRFGGNRQTVAHHRNTELLLFVCTFQFSQGALPPMPPLDA